MPGKLGLGLGETIMSSSSPAATIDDYLWDLVSAGNLEPLASGTVSDFHDSWDLDSVDYMPEVSPDDEGYWDDMPELVLNGLYEELGSELVTNGDFSSGSTGFDVFGVAALDGNVIDFIDGGSNTYSGIRQDITSVAGELYEVKITVDNWVQGSVNAVFGTNNTDFNVTGDGDYTAYLSPSSTGNDIEISRVFSTGANFSYSISNVSVKQVDPNDRWELANGALISSGQLTLPADSANVSASQNIGDQTGNTLELTYTVVSSNISGGNFRVGGSSGASVAPSATNLTSSVGTHTAFIEVPTSGTNTVLDLYLTTGVTSGSLVLDNVSVKEYAIRPLDV